MGLRIKDQIYHFTNIIRQKMYWGVAQKHTYFLLLLRFTNSRSKWMFWVCLASGSGLASTFVLWKWCITSLGSAFVRNAVPIPKFGWFASTVIFIWFWWRPRCSMLFIFHPLSKKLDSLRFMSSLILEMLQNNCSRLQPFSRNCPNIWPSVLPSFLVPVDGQR